MWLFPAFVKKATYSPDNYPFVYYSSILKQLCIINYSDKKMPMTDMAGNRYTTAQFDSLMPLLNYRQLMSDGKLPDSIAGVEITPPLLRSKSVNYRYAPKERSTPGLGLYILFESMPKRVGIEMPDDVFRMEDNIEFIDVEINKINEKKSVLFTKALEKAGYQFPAQWTRGNPNPRKAYDEGYFTLDAKGDLFHIKMVNNKPFIKNTGVGENMQVEWFSMYEAPDKRFYGFLFDKTGNVYILESNAGKYVPLRLDIEDFDLSSEQITVMGNLLYWTVWVTASDKRTYYGLETETLKKVDEYKVDRKDNKWDKFSKYLFPFYLTFENENSDFIKPHFIFISFFGFIINVLLAIFIVVSLKESDSKRIFNFIFIFITGIAGFLSLLILPKSIKK
jgi:hypothetical protein